MTVERHRRELEEALTSLTGRRIDTSLRDDADDGTVELALGGTATALLRELLGYFDIWVEESENGVSIAGADVWRAARAFELADASKRELSAAVRAGQLEPDPGLIRYRSLVGSIKPNEWADMSKAEQAKVLAERAERRQSPNDWARAIAAACEAIESCVQRLTDSFQTHQKPQV